MLVRNPGSGTAETKHTLSRPYWTVTLPPSEGTVCNPGPPLHFAPDGRGVDGTGARVAEGDGEGVRGVGGGDAGDAVVVGGALGVVATDEAGTPTRTDGEGYTAWTDRAAGGVGRVRPMTKYTVSITAVTLAAVHDSHMRR